MKTFGLRVIKNEKEYNSTLKRIDKILDSKPGTKEFDELELISLLVEKYEEGHYPIPSAKPVDIIRFLMEQKGLKNNDLVGILGNKTTVSRVLNSQRDLSLNMIKKLHAKFKLPYSVLIDC
jgi:HTH-type transcriptional regulator/antitoxin HigA